MRVYGIFIAFIIFLIIIPDIYIYLRFIRNRVRTSIAALHWVISAYFIIVSLSILFNINTILSPDTSYHFMIFITALGAVYIPKLVFVTFDLFFFLTKKRWRKIQYAGYILATIAFFAITYAVGWGKFNFQRREFTVTLDNLPDNFDGYKIVFFTDMHLGNFSGLQKRVKPLFDMMNRENADLIVFTGDMVNNFASEFDGWEPYFLNLKSKDGKIAILGNHDYSVYYNWKSNDLRSANQQGILDGIRKLGFNLLLNQSVTIGKECDTIAIVGTENWGRAPHPQYADLEKAMKDTETIPLKILLTHDPDYWEEFIVGKEKIPLTLAGHTHGAQIGVDWGFIKLSPAQLRINFWDGIYKINDQYLIVSRGVGNAGVPARLGMSPEYVVITLRKKENRD
jgi:predicted MPP superfamily phosphohydrolase